MTMAREVTTAEAAALVALVFAPSSDPHDYARWYEQGFAFYVGSEAEHARAKAWQWHFGLVQGQGGPCGVFAVVQAEMVRLHLFQEDGSCGAGSDGEERERRLMQPLGDVERAHLLARALAAILYACSANEDASNQRRTVQLVSLHPEKQDARVYVVESVMAASEDDEALVQAVQSRIGEFQQAHGVISFLFSAILSKGIDQLRAEMDDQGACLTGQFGHCNQELVNFLLTGHAVSNVFDGTVPMGDSGLVLRGIPTRNRIGYLTQLEALRYCQVGSFFKAPKFPIWVIGSSSHFSVLFSVDTSLCEESASEVLFQRLQRVFKSFDPMETGMMEIGGLAESLNQLGVSSAIYSDNYRMAQLVSRLEVGSGAGVLLWDDYWKVVSVLLHTNDFELALSGKYEPNDESVPSKSEARPRSDSDIARELQAQFDAESSSAASSVPVADSRPSSDIQELEKQAVLFFYNGLRGPPATTSGAEPALPLIRCRITIRERSNFVGKSVSLSLPSGDGGSTGPPLEAVIMTRWPRIRFLWDSPRVPSID